MLITALVENRSILPALDAEHGLSLMIETARHQILFDVGKSSLFLKNAEALGLSISTVDIAVISHGHYDHGGGLFSFLQNNLYAPVYIREQAFESHLSVRPNEELADIGLDRSLLSSGRFIFTKEQETIGNGVTLFSNVIGRDLFSDCNASILMQQGESVRQDDFVHEQNLILEEGQKVVLIAGCAHCGIVNILRRTKERIGRMPNVVVGGFHLHNPSTGKNEPEDRIRAVGKVLSASGALFYTGHCTGDEPFSMLHEMLREQIRPLHAGTAINI